MSINVMLQDIDTLNEIIEAIDNKDLSTAKDKAIVWRDKLQGEVDSANEYYNMVPDKVLDRFDYITKE